MSSEQKLRQPEDVIENKEKLLPLWRKITFAFGGVPYQATSNVIAFFVTVFLLEVAQLPPRYVSIILFSGKAWDAITDPTIGILVHKTNTRWGKMRPWILFSAPFACATYFLLFYVPWNIVTDTDGKERIDANDFQKFAYYFAMFCLFEGFLSCLHVPYTAMTMYVATNQKDRDSITAIRMGFEAVGVLVAVFIQGLFVSNTRCNGESKKEDTPSLGDQLDAYTHGSYVMIGIYLLCCLVVFYGSKEKPGVILNNNEDNSFWKGLKLVFTFKPFLWASLTFLFMYMGIAIIQGNLALYCTYTLKIGDQFTYYIALLLIVSIVSLPGWHFVSSKFGKKTAYAAGLILMFPTFLATLFMPEGVYWLFYIMVVISGLSISVSFLLPWSILPDVLDLYMIENNTRHDSLFYSFYVFFNKFATGIALALSQLVLEFGGYRTGECKQSAELATSLRYLMGPGPVVFVLIALLALHKYPINETKRRFIRQRMLELVVDYEENVAVESARRSYDSLSTISNGNEVTHM